MEGKEERKERSGRARKRTEELITLFLIIPTTCATGVVESRRGNEWEELKIELEKRMVRKWEIGKGRHLLPGGYWCS